ncbi:MAG: tyrosine--tRNA ligase [Buchnera aphidicola (Eriosoma harunire)]
MNNNNIIDSLKLRNLIFQISDEKKLFQLTNSSVISLYCGFDPTADSLHVGHLLPLIVLKHFQILGHKPIVLIGGATSLIGDPSFKNLERQLCNYDTVHNWEKKISKQVSLFLDFDSSKNAAKIVNNYDWFSKIDFLHFFRNIGKHFSITQMINKDSVKHRINRFGNGISFTEFSYSLFQAYDFLILNQQHQVCLQIGGSDQWGNITSGIKLVRQVSNKNVFGLTLPLLTQNNGNKFGKTERDVVWLDPDKTSPYKFYQFWINTSDESLYSFLKWFTFLEYSEIVSMESSSSSLSNMQQDRILLAREMTKLVHGIKGLLSAVRISTCLFHGQFSNMQESDFYQLKKDGMPVFKLYGQKDLLSVLVISELAQSRSQARNMIISNAISINHVKVSTVTYIFNSHDKLFGKFTLLKRGKKNYSLLYWQ